ncbi:ribose-phosphate pyrophosphokinase [Candidatus Shapirobacteria bacterium]|nr:ribose-phosphate pyrophosphokinase [Candidatus Shapirobacteria bacterium]
MEKIKIVGGRSHPALARKIAQSLKVPLIPTETKAFVDGEIYVRILKNIRGDDVFVVQSLCSPVNEHLMELLIIIDALRRASADKINVVCPYLAYSRQDRKAASREPITAKLLANLLTKAGASRILTVDLHTDQIQGFYDIPVDHIVGYPRFADYLLRKKHKKMVVVAPDIGGVKRGRKMAGLMRVPLAIIDKRRSNHNQSEVINIIGEVKGQTAVIVDDIIDTAGTITQAAQVLKQKGAADVILCATHGLLSGEACQRLQNSPASQVLLLDTVPLPKEKKISKIKVITLAPLLTKVIKRIHQGKSVGALFTWEEKEVAL